jgi:acid phosphatase type 7
MLKPGAVRPHIKKGHSQAHPGVSALSTLTHRNTGYQPLPRPLGLPPYHYALSDSFPDAAKLITDSGKMVIDVLGDSGGVKDAEFQDNVAAQMVEQIGHAGPGTPQFCYHVGDVVYFTGAHDDYYSQFYEAYASYTPPIFAIPGNHDGEVDDPSAQTSLDGWVAYFMQANPDVDPISEDAPRVGLNLLLDSGYTPGNVRRHVHECPRARLDRLQPATMAHERIRNRTGRPRPHPRPPSPHLLIRCLS